MSYKIVRAKRYFRRYFFSPLLMEVRITVKQQANSKSIVHQIRLLWSFVRDIVPLLLMLIALSLLPLNMVWFQPGIEHTRWHWVEEVCAIAYAVAFIGQLLIVALMIREEYWKQVQQDAKVARQLIQASPIQITVAREHMKHPGCGGQLYSYRPTDQPRENATWETCTCYCDRCGTDYVAKRYRYSPRDYIGTGYGAIQKS